jgi:hypothetical protein
MLLFRWAALAFLSAFLSVSARAAVSTPKSTPRFWRVDGGSSSETTPCTDAVYEALIAFYHATNGPSWNHNDGWLSSRDPCSGNGKTPHLHVFFCATRFSCFSFVPCSESLDVWNGVEPDTFKGEVIKIKIQDMVDDYDFSGATGGTLPTELGVITTLTEFKFENSRLHGACALPSNTCFLFRTQLFVSFYPPRDSFVAVHFRVILDYNYSYRQK